MATYDHELILIQRSYVEDDIGNQVPVETRMPILCDVRSIGRNEFYNAAVANLRPEMTFLVHAFEYNGERKVEFNGQQYSVLRTYADGTEEVELTCERVGDDG